MGAIEVLEVLRERRNDWLTINEIEEKVGDLSRMSVSNTLKRLFLHEEIYRKKGDYARNCYLYKYKKG